MRSLFPVSQPLASARWRWTALWLALLVSATRIPEAHAHQLVSLSVETLVRRAAVVLEANVTAVRSEWNASGTQIVTHVQLDVVEYYKGDLGPHSLEITQLGGTVDDVTFAVLGQPTFAVDERTFLFLAPNYGLGEFPLVAGEQGKFRVSTDGTTRVEILQGIGAPLPKASVVSTVRDIANAAAAAARRP